MKLLSQKILTRFLTGLTVLFSLSALSLKAESNFEYKNTEDLIDFAVLYPLPIFKDKSQVDRRQWGTAGFRFNYQFYLNDHLGILLTPHAWFVPTVIHRGAGKPINTTLFSASIESGLAFRVLPNSYLDPTIQGSSGFSFMDCGNTINSKKSFPVSGEIGLNLYRQRSPFMDGALALNAFGGVRYYFNSLSVIEPYVFHFGLAFRGSF